MFSGPPQETPSEPRRSGTMLPDEMKFSVIPPVNPATVELLLPKP